MQRRLTASRQRISQGIDDIREYGRIAGFWQIARRAFANNSFDGVLTTIGLLMGSYVAGVRDASVVIRTGVATSMAMGISGLWGSWLAESAERGRDLAELEEIALTDLGQTKIGRASRMAVVVVSIVDGLAPFLSSMFVLIPLFLSTMMNNIVVGYLLCLAVALLSLFVLGAWLGSISRTSIVGYGIRTVVAGIVAIALSFLLGA
jgi:predicted membrane protein (TIGR00267 family)